MILTFKIRSYLVHIASHKDCYDLVRAYQNAIKNFCEDPNQSVRNDKSTFRGESSIIFFNQETRQVVIFDQETKIFITAYKLAERSVDEYLTTGNIGSN